MGKASVKENFQILLTDNSLPDNRYNKNIGLDGKKAENGRSTLGLQSIRRRVQYLNGEININSNTKGTEIIVSIPLEK